MAMNVMSNLRQSAEYIEKARNEENENGDPLKGATYYLTAMELIMQWAAAHAFTLATERERQYFLFQVRQKVEVYAERVHLLLHVAESVGLLDKPTLPDQMELLPARASAAAAAAASATPGVNGNAQPTSSEEQQHHENRKNESEPWWEEKPVKPTTNTSPNNINKNKNKNSMNAGGQGVTQTEQQPNDLVQEATSINILSEPFIQPQQNNTIASTDPVLGIPLKPESEGETKHTK